MVRLDGRKLTAPLLAQAVAFVAVLVIGGLTGHGHGHGHGKQVTTSSSSPTSPATNRTSSAPHPSVPSQVNTSTGGMTELTILAVGGVPMPTVDVKVFRDDPAFNPALVVSITLSKTVPEQTESVLAGHTYLVCAKPPHGWTFTGHGTSALPGLYCFKVEAGTPAQPVTFQLMHSPQLIHPSPSTGGSRS